MMAKPTTARREVPTLIVGLGETGLSAARFFDRAGEPFEVVDDREQPPAIDAFRENWPNVSVRLGRFGRKQFARARRIVVSPGVSLREPAVAEAIAAGTECIGDIELFARAADAPVIAITGSNGKSTVTALTGALLEAAGRTALTGGNLGPPALDLLAHERGVDPDFYVLELSSFQLESTWSLQPLAAVVLNVSADHMDRYRDVAEYAAAKGRIYRSARTAVVNRDDPGAARLAGPVSRRIGFTLGPPGEADFGVVQHEGEDWLAEGATPLLPVRELSLAGAHNAANALAALALVRAAGVEPADAVDGLRTFEGLPHRMQHVATIGDVDWYDDSKGTNVGATVAAINGLARPLVLIAGGTGKGADFASLRDAVTRWVRAVVLIGEDAGRIAEAIEGAAPVENAGDLDTAVDRAAELAEPGDAVLLSPACASFDQFRDYHARGEAFVTAVRRRQP